MMRRVLLILAIALVSAAFAGCYTMLSHPTVGTMGSVHGEGRNCQDCHSDAEYYYYDYPYYYDSYWQYRNWWSYYCDPWWWGSNYWSWPDSDHGVQLPVERTQIYNDRVRPGERPAVVPGASTTQSDKQDTTPQSGGGKDTKATDDTRRTRSKQTPVTPSNRPPRPSKRPEKPKKEEKKAKERE